MGRSDVTRTLWLALLALGLASFGAAPVSADEVPACNNASTATLAFAPDLLDAAVETSDGIGAASTCEAQCWDGSTVVCDEGSSCTAQDSNCSWGVQGYCEDSSGRKYCPPCPDECSATASCPSGGSVTCEGTDQCIAVDGCYAYCDGTYHWCFEADPNSCPLL